MKLGAIHHRLRYKNNWRSTFFMLRLNQSIYFNDLIWQDSFLIRTWFWIFTDIIRNDICSEKKTEDRKSWRFMKIRSRKGSRTGNKVGKQGRQAAIFDIHYFLHVTSQNKENIFYMRNFRIQIAKSFLYQQIYAVEYPKICLVLDISACLFCI